MTPNDVYGGYSVNRETANTKSATCLFFATNHKNIIIIITAKISSYKVVTVLTLII